MSVVKINAITVPAERADELVARFAARAGEVSSSPGFESFELLRPSDDRETFLEAAAIDSADPLRGFFKIPPDAEPGTLFAYNQPPVIALATILQGLAGERLTEYLRPRVLDPLGIGDLRWAQLRPGIDMGFSGVHTNLDAVARLGQLYLDDGVWEGRRLLPAGWVAEASAVQIANPQREEPDWRQGYGFQLWRPGTATAAMGRSASTCSCSPSTTP